jgi:hypothetical protein
MDDHCNKRLKELAAEEKQKAEKEARWKAVL